MNPERKHFLKSLLIPLLFVLLLWLIKALETLANIRLSNLGIFPQQLAGLPGIITSPLIHGDLNHLYSNSVPLLALGTGSIYFFRKHAYYIFFIVYFLTGAFVWLWARPVWHIGASGIIYALASFLLFSGVMRRFPAMLAVSLLVIFLYGGMVWGLLPVQPGVSWESHLAGAVSGFFAAILFRNKGPKLKPYDWEKEEQNENAGQEENQVWNLETYNVPPPVKRDFEDNI